MSLVTLIITKFISSFATNSAISMIGMTLFAQLSMGPTAPNSSTENPIIRTVHFRDGSRLQLQLPESNLTLQSRNGNDERVTLSLSLFQTEKIQVSKYQEQLVFDQLDDVVNKLADDRYWVRKQAAKELLKFPLATKKRVLYLIHHAHDLEVRAQLRTLLHHWPNSDVSTITELSDRITLRGSEAIQKGDLGDWKSYGTFRGIPIQLNREKVAVIDSAPPITMNVATPNVGAGNYQRIDEYREQDFPPHLCRFIDFEQAPSGADLKPGDNLSREFIPWGFSLETSMQDSYISVNSYNVGGVSGGQSCATHAPSLFRGVITIRFCMPNHPQVKAGVHRVGFSAAAVRPDGTTLEAYDVFDRLIGKVSSRTNQRDFLGIESKSAISYIRIVPDPNIDPDYTIDDLVFDFPKPLSDQGIERYFTIRLHSGEQLYAETIKLESKSITLTNISLGLDRFQFDLQEVAAVIAPYDLEASPSLEAVPWAKLEDGSIVRIKQTIPITPFRFSEFAIEPNTVVAIWGKDASFQELERNITWKEEQALLIHEGKEHLLENWKFGKVRIESDSIPTILEFTYLNSPLIWLQKPTGKEPSTGLLRLNSGEEFRLGEDSLFQVSSWKEEGITLHRGEQSSLIPAEEILAYFPPKSNRVIPNNSAMPPVKHTVLKPVVNDE